MTTNHQPIHDMNTTTQNPLQSNPPVKPVLKLGLDVDLQQVTVTIQCEPQHRRAEPKIVAARYGSASQLSSI